MTRAAFFRDLQVAAVPREVTNTISFATATPSKPS
jgi:hypothetical protein